MTVALLCVWWDNTPDVQQDDHPLASKTGGIARLNGGSYEQS